MEQAIYTSNSLAPISIENLKKVSLRRRRVTHIEKGSSGRPTGYDWSDERYTEYLNIRRLGFLS